MKKLLFLLVALVATSTAWAQDTWTVAGTAAILNGTDSWAPANAANDMTSTDGVNFTLAVEGKTLEAGVNYEYKVLKNHAWTEAYPGTNAILTVNETAVYTITYTFNAETKDVAANAVKTGEAGEITHEYSIAGSNADLFGAAWSETNTATDMTKGNDGVYSWTSAETELAFSTIEYKIVEDHSWGVSYGYNGGNATFNVTEAGKYVLKFTFDPTTKDVGCEVVSFEETKYYIRHPWGGGDWSWQELESNGDGTYSVVAQYGNNGCNWDTSNEGDGFGKPWITKEELEFNGTPAVGDWCEFTVDPTNNSITVTKLYPSVYVIVGNEEIKLNEYMYEDSKKEIRVDYTSGNTTKELKADDEISFKMVSADGSVTKYLVPDFNKKGIWEDVLDGKYSCVFKESETPGSYTVKNDGTYHFAVSLKDGVVMISGNIITGVEDVEVAGKAVKAYKVIENGQVVIVRGEQRFNIMGQPIR